MSIEARKSAVRWGYVAYSLTRIDFPDGLDCVLFDRIVGFPVSVNLEVLSKATRCPNPRGMDVDKTWFGWLTRKDDDADMRQTDVPPVAIAIRPDDIDPLTGALHWSRFTAMLEAEQAQGPGVLLIIDLSAHTGRLSAEDEEILPWLARTIKKAIRSDDLLAHVEGMRFAALLRGAPQHIGAAVSERIFDMVDDTVFATPEGTVHLGATVAGAVYAQSTENDAFDVAVANMGVARASGRAVLVL